MDISKLSRHTKQAKKRIALALDLGENALSKLKPKKKKISIDINDPLQAIKSILQNLQITDKIESNGINAEKVIRHICGENGAAKKLSNSMLTKSKKADSFKKLAEKLEGITEENNSLQNNPDETERLLTQYINGKKRGKEENNGKDAREIDFLKLLCAALVLVAINGLKENETPKVSLPASSGDETQEEIPASSSISEKQEEIPSASGLETGSVDGEDEEEEEASEQNSELGSVDDQSNEENELILNGKKIENIRIVGNVDWREGGKNTRYVLSQDGKQLIIYPAFKSDMNLGYIANHLYSIAGKTKSSYPDDQEYFPTDRTVVVSKLSDAAINGIIKAKTNEKILEWKDFEAEKLNNYVHSLDESGNLSKNWLTYGKAMTMTEDVWKEIFAKEENKACDYIAKELPNITKQSKTFNELQEKFNSVMKKEEVLSIIELLQSIKNNFENPSNLDLPTKDEINNQGYHLTDDAYEALNEFCEEAKWLSKPNVGTYDFSKFFEGLQENLDKIYKKMKRHFSNTKILLNIFVTK